ncbi:MAG: hypothetical protein D6704_03225 [Nitrospirae bacterium]|nr:MAG: hypothetical protein D6704_03225 [Nitrospirota bacterium]
MKLLLYAGLIFLLVPIQTTILHSLSPFGIRPDLCLVAACLIGFWTGHVEGGAMGGLLGFVQDLFSGGTLWLNTVTKALVGFSMGVLIKHFANLTSQWIFFPVVIFSLISGMVFLVFARGAIELIGVVQHLSIMLVPQALLDGMLAVVANWALTRRIAQTDKL